MKKAIPINAYFKIAQTSWLRGIEYRFGVFYMILEAFLPTVAMFLMWKAIYANGDTVANYSLNQLITYFIGARIINYLIWYQVDWDLNEKINKGILSSLLLKPIDVQAYYVSEMIGDRFVKFFLGCIPLSIIMLILKKYISISLDLKSIIIFIIAIIGSAALWFLLSWIIGCYAFWAHNLVNILFVKHLIITILSGGFFPLDLLPHTIVRVIDFTPFPYLAFFPLKIITGSASQDYIVHGLIVQLIWIILFFILGRVIWRKGVKNYVEVGG
ncbi:MULTISPECIES: ABC transporter permease [Bacillus]|uniref:ABC transporter permease n=4 Tax=Bacillus cereus group TaxID=86661 RepID=B7ISD7_BACC2|nr:MULTISPECIES: ABC-2 family transporter protein [Bacillus]ACK94025.1 protein of unknown function, putative [Bacillus cereus G9842]KAA0805761.1 ABC transporter permease [Bacillus sp. AY2-1]KAB2394119.1 ABC transporter permease [Bacillus cereus]MBJ7963621.1 ABC-2 family transporter protein [Bacillus cereus]MBJ8000138.1 ABC-2 family transporter protein [Bacillus cereus]